MKSAEGPPERELYALMHVAPDASDEEIRRAYRHWAQVYHPDKYQAPQMKEIATDNFQRIREAYEILSDEQKRVIYDIYGMEGINSGLELGPRLSKVEELKEEIERMRRRKEEEMSAFIRPTGSLHAGFSVPRFLSGDSLMRGMAMSSEVQSQISKRNTISISGNMAVTGNAGGSAATVTLRHQISSVASIEFMAAVGLKSLLGVQTTRHLSAHSTATAGVTVSLRDGSVNLSNVWTRQLSDSSNGNIQLILGLESSIAIGWYRKTEKSSASGQIKLGTNSFGATGHYTHHLSSKSHARIAGRFGSNALELEIGAGRKISDSSTVRMFYSIGIQGISWKFEFHRAGQKLIIPVLLSRHLGPYISTGALIGPALLYFLLKKFVVKPYCLKRERQKKLEMAEKSSVQIKEARTAAEKAQQLLQNVASRKMKKQLEIGGLVITKAYYGNEKAVQKMLEGKELDDDLASQVLDVTIPLCFLVNDLGQLKLHDGIKKAGIMGFCDLCPGDPKQLLVEYNKGDAKYMVVVDDYAELVIPQEDHRVGH